MRSSDLLEAMACAAWRPGPKEEESERREESEVPAFMGFGSPNGDFQNFPIMYPMLMPQQETEEMNRGPGLYAVPVNPFMGFSSNTLIPFTYNVPTAHTTSEVTATAEDQGQVGPQQLNGPQRQVVIRRFQIAIQIDLLLMLKLAAVIFLFNQDGSRQRLALLVFFAILIYLYQTGALAPLIRWLSQGQLHLHSNVGPLFHLVEEDNKAMSYIKIRIEMEQVF